MRRETTIILGGGAAGLSLAYYLNQRGLPFALFEASPHLGGLCRTQRSGEFAYDLGAHRFHDQDAEITRDVTALLQGEIRRIHAPSAICWKGHRIGFPLSPFNLLRSVPVRESLRFLKDFAFRKPLGRPFQNMEELAEARFGKSMARAFLLDYSEKLWGYPACQLAPQAATKRLNGISLWSIIRELFKPESKMEHIDGAFWYPNGGFGEITRRMKQALPAGSLFRNHKVSHLTADPSAITEIQFENGLRITNPGRVISTLPLTLHPYLMGAACPDSALQSAQSIRFRHLRLFFFKINKPSVSRDISLYFPDAEIPFTRAHEPKNRSPQMAPQSQTSLLVEVPFFNGDAWENEPADSLGGRIQAHLVQKGLIRLNEILSWEEKRVPHAYPVYNLDYEAHVKTILNYLGTFQNLIPFGRNGTFFYSHLHDQMRAAKNLVNALSPLEILHQEAA